MKLGRWGWLAATNPIGAVVIGGTDIRYWPCESTGKHDG